MLRCALVAVALLVAPAASAQGAPGAAANADDKKADDKKADVPVVVPPLPPAVTDAGPVDTETSGAPATDELQRLKAQLKAELEAELKAQLQNEMEAAARDSATRKASAQEWQEERWVEELRPNLNFLEMDGYFRTRFDLFNRLDLGTYDPVSGNGTSNVAPPTLYRPFDGTSCDASSPENYPGGPCSTASDDNQSLMSLNMRLRLDPTLNVSEDIRVRATIDVFDNLVFGSTPAALGGNATATPPLFGNGANPPQAGINTITDALRIRRLWGEVTTPVGELRFGRMPLDFGLGIHANAGNGLDQDQGDNVDQVQFSTRVAGFTIAPAYSLSTSGLAGRGPLGQPFSAAEGGQRFNLDPKDDLHTVFLTVHRKDKEEDLDEVIKGGGLAFNYGLFASWQTQKYDVPAAYAGVTTPIGPQDFVKRDANIGTGSLWGLFRWEKLTIEAEATGSVGQIGGTALTSGSLTAGDPLLRVVEGGTVVAKPLFVLQGGLALQSSYLFLNDQLEVGLDGGLASGDDAFGMGIRPGLKRSPRAGDRDGAQYGDCLERTGTAVDGVDCTRVDNDVTNYRFNPDYIVDMILFREVLGTVSDAFYVKPHIGYYFTPDLGVRADIIYSQSFFASSTPGQNWPLGVEIDGRGFWATEDGFHLMPQFGVLIPLGGLAHYSATTLSDRDLFGNPQFAWTFQVLGGITF